MSIDSFLIPQKELDLESWRLNYPLDALLMINTRCVTDCVYCYADRQLDIDCKIPINRLTEFIREAGELGMRSFDITGGEFFRYKHWETLLQELLANGFSPYISTKFPIDPETIIKLKDFGLKKIQVSIDSIVKGELMQMLDVPENYLNKLLETLHCLDDNGFEIHTNTQLTKYNQDNIDGLLDFLLTLKNIKRVVIGTAGFSFNNLLFAHRRQR